MEEDKKKKEEKKSWDYAEEIKKKNPRGLQTLLTSK